MSKVRYSLREPTNASAARQGFRDGIPIGIGYFAVAFSLGVAARNAGLTAFQGFLASLLCNASAGEYMGFTLIAAGATYVEIAIATLIANARYLLMSCALSQKASPDLPIWHRLIIAFDITDELFGINIAREGMLNPCYTYGAMIPALAGWSVGTMFGVIAGNIMPLRLVSALSVALYGMFLAVIIPPARKSLVVAGLVAVSFLASWGAAYLPLIGDVSEGTRTIILTLVISSAAALLFPRKEEEGCQ